MKLLFVAIPRTGSTSIREALEPHGLENVRIDNPTRHAPAVTIPSVNLDAPILSFVHSDIATLVRTGVIKRNTLKDYTAFAVHRNPWDRAVSLWHYLFGVLGRHRETYGDLTFSDFITKITTTLIPPPSELNWRGLSQVYPASYWVMGAYPYVNEIRPIAYSGLSEHVRNVMEWFDIKVELGHANKTENRRPYQEYYNLTTRDAVARYYADDIKLGRYEFDGSD